MSSTGPSTGASVTNNQPPSAPPQQQITPPSTAVATAVVQNALLLPLVPSSTAPPPPFTATLITHPGKTGETSGGPLLPLLGETRPPLQSIREESHSTGESGGGTGITRPLIVEPPPPYAPTQPERGPTLEVLDADGNSTELLSSIPQEGSCGRVIYMSLAVCAVVFAVIMVLAANKAGFKPETFGGVSGCYAAGGLSLIFATVTTLAAISPEDKGDDRGEGGGYTSLPYQAQGPRAGDVKRGEEEEEGGKRLERKEQKTEVVNSSSSSSSSSSSFSSSSSSSSTTISSTNSGSKGGRGGGGGGTTMVDVAPPS